VLIREEVDNSCPSLNNNSLIVPQLMETTVAVAASTTEPSDMPMLNLLSKKLTTLMKVSTTTADTTQALLQSKFTNISTLLLKILDNSWLL
jgi:hypothetical protein